MDSPFIAAGLPVALAVTMLGLGLGLTTADFRRVVAYPRTVMIALGCQTVLLPALCFVLVVALELPPASAVGMMLLAASPGGTTANLYSHLFGGHVALNVTLTAVNSILAIVTLPIVVNLSAAYFTDDAAGLGLQFGKVLQIFAIVLIPVAIGMAVRARSPRFAGRLDRPVRVLSVAVLAAATAGAVLAERDNLAAYFAAVGVAVVIFNVASIAIGYGVPRLVGADRPASIAVGMEIGIHNSTLAITIAISPTLLGNTEMAVPAAVYGIVAIFTAVAFGVLAGRRRADEAPALQRRA
ncbi:bile acid:sodium symporter family protein [Actinoplanes sp. NPDC023714]|uniref:bile acid:sodium symporter family protein n=1 Tax=Actinoplanes sp. NPDC023714 TaxID=3154322 RepID=UPI0033F16873